MELLGITFGLSAAILWGSADTIASLAARRLGTFKTTFVSQSVGFLALICFGLLAYWLWRLPFTLTTLAMSILIGIFTGLSAAFGYFFFYRALEVGPVALVSPLSSTSSVFTLILSFFILQQHLTLGQIACVFIIILGIVLASIHLAEIRTLLHKPGYSMFSKGIRWAIIATIAFGVMDFGIGASASLNGYFLPVLWTRIFSVLFLTLISLWKRHERLTRAQKLSLSALGEEALRRSKISLEDALIAQPSPNQDPEATLIGSPWRNRNNETAIDPEATLIGHPLHRHNTEDALDPEATFIGRPLHSQNTILFTKSDSALRRLELGLEDTFVIQPSRSISTMLTTVSDANSSRRLEPGPLDTISLQLEEVDIPNAGDRTLSLSLPSLEDLAHISMPLTSIIGLGVLLACIAGIAENAAVLLFSFDTQVATTGIASAITSSYSLIALLFGIIVYRERLTGNQLFGIILFMIGLVSLAFTG